MARARRRNDLGACAVGALSVYHDDRAEASGDSSRLGREMVGRRDDGSVVLPTNQVLIPSVIFVIEDDAQNGVDHVDGHRTIGYVISPYTRRGVVDSRYYTQIDMVRAMEQILGLPPMNQIPLDELNPSPTALRGIQREWALASGAMDFSRPDVAGEDLLNRVIWYATKRFDRAYPGDGRVLGPSEAQARAGARLIELRVDAGRRAD